MKITSKTTVSQPAENEITYPCLLKCNESSLVVLFWSVMAGVCVVKGEGRHEVGFVSKTWVPGHCKKTWTPFYDEVTLKMEE